MRHPKIVLFAGEKPFPILPAVDHYAGSEKLMRKALLLQKELGPIFDITCDCEDGAHAGAEREHAEEAKRMPREEFAARLLLGVRGDRSTAYRNPFSDLELAALIATYEHGEPAAVAAPRSPMTAGQKPRGP